jgi:hypothetical protein
MFQYFTTISILSFIFVSVSAKPFDLEAFDSIVCDSLPQFSQRIKDQIRDSAKDVQKIIDYVVNGPDRGKTYDELSKFVDKFGARFAGTQTFEDSIDYMVDMLKKDNHENVHTENAPLIPWVYFSQNISFFVILFS